MSAIPNVAYAASNCARNTSDVSRLWSLYQLYSAPKLLIMPGSLVMTKSSVRTLHHMLGKIPILNVCDEILTR